MKIIGCDFHTRYQQIAMLDEATGELAGGACFGAVLNFRVAHLSRRVTGGAFDLDSLIEKSK